jgi:hypothetical protein
VPCITRVIAATRPACWSEITNRTPPRPRFFSPARKPRQEAPPEHLVLGVADVETEDLPAAVGGDTGGDHDGLGDHDAVLGTDVEVGGVEEEVGELGVVQPPGAERPDALVEPGADPGDLGLRDPGGAHRDHQVLHAAGRDAVDVGLHHHRIQRLVDATARFEDRGEERSAA